MKRTLILALFAFALMLAASSLPAQQPPAPGNGTVSSQKPSMPVEEIIQKFAAKEAEFRRARDNYTYRQTVRVQEMDDDASRVLGKYEMIADVIFTPQRRRLEKVVFAPQSTLKRISLSPEDDRDLREIQPFVLTTEEIPKYNIRYLGRQRVDEIDAYVFFVSPKTMEKGQRYFEGQIWVDDRDLQIVKTYGKAVPDVRGGKGDGENLFPRFETYREQIDGKYWFPTYTRADDTLHFSSGPVRIRMIVKYEDYKYFGAESTIKFEGVDENEGQAKPATPPKPKP